VYLKFVFAQGVSQLTVFVSARNNDFSETLLRQEDFTWFNKLVAAASVDSCLPK
jgi:hypothetical protein